MSPWWGWKNSPAAQITKRARRLPSLVSTTNSRPFFFTETTSTPLSTGNWWKVGHRPQVAGILDTGRMLAIEVIGGRGLRGDRIEIDLAEGIRMKRGRDHPHLRGPVLERRPTPRRSRIARFSTPQAFRATAQPKPAGPAPTIRTSSRVEERVEGSAYRNLFAIVVKRKLIAVISSLPSAPACGKVPCHVPIPRDPCGAFLPAPRCR